VDIMGGPFENKTSENGNISFLIPFFKWRPFTSHIACMWLEVSPFQLLIQKAGCHEPSCISYATRGHPNAVNFISFRNPSLFYLLVHSKCRGFFICTWSHSNTHHSQ
jgi:hypothetical protein